MSLLCLVSLTDFLNWTSVLLLKVNDFLISMLRSFASSQPVEFGANVGHAARDHHATNLGG